MTTPTPHEVMQQALEALLYHTEQTRPIERTELAIDALRTALAAQPTDETKSLRRLLCITYAGARAYMDDGEAQDSSTYPFIDFMRDSVELIHQKMQRRSLEALAAQPAPTVKDVISAAKEAGIYPANSDTHDMLARFAQVILSRFYPATAPDGWQPADGMDAKKAAYFMDRFKREEKLRGPNEQAAVDFVIAMLTAAPTPTTVPDDVVRDAERYRWLRSDDIEVMPGQREIYILAERMPHTDDQDEVMLGTDADAAIDAAIAAAKEKP